ncbi:tRNA threonylcarbamoyladenosine biosynthesis protein TsaE [Shimia gijangensis]|uniref:tRNA threonylcarbamoyladenosine biosynthesis protein TsaE n=1 Tax=Shimia gijangensis TaxID=1470563 RepID=A0A1M6MTN3_9RHOB|nr:tRNA (adenosine(37)-N6)-threonylcarbamoyltransferase complex ATPase subunit type 1 TsaE [Shimia gijangensis]SHJ86885.1 tRNA threonylcarbamoyladenosine biosynthesis protein TsaE [Shimia gijangensis]
MSGLQSKISLASPEDTRAIAQRLGGYLHAGDVLLFEGDIGAGKTHFARCLIQSLLPEPEDVPSPTFTLVQTYETPDFEIWHADLYRLSSPDEVVELGLTEAFEDAVCLVEWPDRLAELKPEKALTLSLQMTDTRGERELTLRAKDSRWAVVLDKMIHG